MIDIKKKIQAARDYARKSYRVIRKVSKNGFMVQRDKNADKHWMALIGQRKRYSKI